MSSDLGRLNFRYLCDILVKLPNKPIEKSAVCLEKSGLELEIWELSEHRC